MTFLIITWGYTDLQGSVWHKECIKAYGRGFCFQLPYKPHPPVLLLNFSKEKSLFNLVRISEGEMKEGNETAENSGWATAIQMFIIICYEWNFILSSSSGLSFPPGFLAHSTRRSKEMEMWSWNLSEKKKVVFFYNSNP